MEAERPGFTPCSFKVRSWEESKSLYLDQLAQLKTSCVVHGEKSDVHLDLDLKKSRMAERTFQKKFSCQWYPNGKGMPAHLSRGDRDKTLVPVLSIAPLAWFYYCPLWQFYFLITRSFSLKHDIKISIQGVSLQRQIIPRVLQKVQNKDLFCFLFTFFNVGIKRWFFSDCRKKCTHYKTCRKQKYKTKHPPPKDNHQQHFPTDILYVYTFKINMHIYSMYMCE